MIFMDKYKKAILIYEQARQKNTKLEEKRRKLISRCSFVDNTDYHSKVCLALAYDEVGKLLKDGNEYYTFGEVLLNGNAEGTYCDNCTNAYHLRINELADARKDFAQAKRNIAHLGKRLIAT